jgi:exosortase A-associated hydrolase 1
MQSEHKCLTFSCAGEQLVGIIHLPLSKPILDVGVVIVVGGPQYRIGSHRQFVLTARALAAAGYVVLRFDLRGMGDSTGDARGFLAAQDDIAAAIEALLKAAPSVRSVCIYGLCDGASAAMLHAFADRRVVGLALVNPWARTDSGEAQAILRHYYWQRIRQKDFWKKLFSTKFGWRQSVTGLLKNVSRAGQGRKKPLSDAADARIDYVEQMARVMQQFRGRTLILLSDNDLTAREFETICRTRQSWKHVVERADVTFERVADADHTFSTYSALKVADNILLEWLASLRRAQG